MTETLSVSWGYQVKAVLPFLGQADTSLTVKLDIGSTQTTTQSSVVTFGQNPIIPVPPLSTVTWCICTTDQTYDIPFTVPVTLTGSVAIESSAPMPSTPEVNAIGAQQIEISNGKFLI